MIKYNGKQYPTRLLTIKIDGEEMDVLIADTSLSDVITKNDRHEEQYTIECQIDEMVYFYVEEGCLNLSAEEICKEHLDEEFEFIKEIF